MYKINLLLFIELIIISIIVCPFCGSNPPLDPSYCGNFLELDGLHRCCYCHKINMEQYNCLLIINETIPEDYECDCENIIENDDLPGAPCLNHSYIMNHSESLTKEYCHSQSIDNKHPCCFYDDGNIKHVLELEKYHMIHCIFDFLIFIIILIIIMKK